MINFFRLLWKMIIKNLKVIFRTKTSALIIIFGPLLIIGIVGIAFNSSELNNVKIGYYTNGTLSASASNVITNLKQSNFKIYEYSSDTKCVHQVKEGNIHACIIFPEGFDLDKPGSEKKIEFAIDFSRMNIAWVITENLMGQIKQESSMFSLKIITQMIDQIRSANEQISDSKNSLVLITSNGEEMSLKITDMKNSINSMNLNFSLKDVNASDIAQLKDEQTSEDIEAFRGKITGIKTEIAAAQQQIEDQKQQSIASLTSFRDKINSTIIPLEVDKASKDAFFAANCSDPSIVDCQIVSYQLSIINSQLALLYDYTDEINSNIESIESQNIPAGDLESQFEGIDKNLDTFDLKIMKIQESTSKFSTQIGELKKKEDELKGTKDTTIQNLDEIEQTVNTNIGEMNTMLENIDQINEKLSSLNVTDSQAIIYPVTTSFRDIGSRGNYLTYLFPSLLVLVVMLISILLSATTVISEKESKAHFRNFLAPVNNFFFIISHYISNSLIILVQTLILLLVAVFAFHISITNWFSVILAFILINSLFILIGLFLGYFFNSEETATLASISISCIMLFFSSTIIPIETMAKKIGFIAYANPFVLSESILRRIIIFDKPIWGSGLEVVVLLIYIVTLFACVMILYSYRKTNIGE